MLTSIRCLAKADELDTYLSRGATDAQRKAYHDVATGWRWVAALAATQEALAITLKAGPPRG